MISQEKGINYCPWNYKWAIPNIRVGEGISKQNTPPPHTQKDPIGVLWKKVSKYLRQPDSTKHPVK